MALPTIIIQGNLTQEVELKYTANYKKPLAIIKVAANERKKDEQGNWVNGDVTYLSCTCWNELAEASTNFLRKGDSVTIVGKLRSKEYTTQNGEKRSTFEVSIDSIAKNVKPNLKQSNVPAPAVQNLIDGGLVNTLDGWDSPNF